MKRGLGVKLFGATPEIHVVGEDSSVVIPFDRHKLLLDTSVEVEDALTKACGVDTGECDPKITASRAGRSCRFILECADVCPFRKPVETPSDQ